MKYLIYGFIFCLGLFSLNAQDINMQNGTFNQCSGNFYDSGGIGGDYGNSENFILTICPDGPDLETVIEFTAFLLNNDGGDFLTVYNSDTNDPLALIGSFSGTFANNPELNFLASTHPTGCLTFEFESNTFFNGPGWEADISCRPTCQVITPQILDIGPTCSIPTSPNTAVPINTPVTFNAGATTSSGDTSDLTYEWFFNVNGPFFGQSVSQTFPNPGDYTVSLTVTDSAGCEGTLTTTVTVGDETISVDDTLFDLDQLIGDVLISGTCSVVNNIVSPNNSSNSGQGFDSYGYFNKECSPFPFDEGIIMATTNINSALNNTTSGGSGAWPGDPDLEALIQQPGNTFNATVIEFEFTPFVDEIQFNYIFASYEYNEFICNFADTFAFILSGPGISPVNNYDHDANPATPELSLDLGGLNIALVPGTTTPVSPVNVHNGTANDGNLNCGAGELGEFAFPAFYDVNNSLPNMPGDIMVDGRTRVLQTIPTTVIPGQVYTIKLAIADRGDTAFDSFVFLEGGSFELGANVGEDLTLEDVNAACEGETRTLEVFEGIAPPGFTFQWLKDGVPIAGATGPTLDVTETGEYCIELQAGTDCDSSDCAFVEFIPVFNAVEDITVNLDLIQCDIANVDPVFDLSENLPDIRENINTEFFTVYPDFQTDNPGVEPYEVTYFLTNPDAAAGTNPIPDPTAFTPNPLNFPVTIYYTVEDSFGLSCSSANTVNGIGTFTLDIFSTTLGDLDDISSCSDIAGTTTATFDLTENNDNAIGTNNPADFTVTYHLNEQDAIDNLNPIPTPDAYVNTSNPQIIWVRLNDDTQANCFATGFFEIEVFTTPQITIPPVDLSQCGDFSLSQTFDLTINDAIALGIVNPADAVLTYHNTQGDADTNTNAITDLVNYLPSNTSETIFIRAESVNSSDCFSTDSFEIDIHDVEIFQPPNINICQPTGDTGLAVFDLTIQNAVIFGANQDPTTHSLSYHTSPADANGGASPIPTPDAYNNVSNPETIYARVQNNNDPNCFEVTSFVISVTEQPVITQTPTLQQCGDFTLTQSFDLTQNDAAMLGIINAGDVVLSYYTSQADANSPVNAIADPIAYVPASVSETIWVRAENVANSTCFAVASFQIEIFDVEAFQPADLSSCAQTNATGLTTWDLSLQDAAIFGANQSAGSHTITYHNSDTDAISGANAIADPANYTNITPVNELIWVRVENDANPSCFAITSFGLSLTEQPEVTIAPEDLTQCGDFTGSQPFDLTTNNAITLGLPDAAGANLSYHNSQGDANTGANPIVNPSIYTLSSNPETIFIRLENAFDSSCFITDSFSVGSFDVEAIAPGDIESCDDGTGNATATFDLTSVSSIALGTNQTLATHNISFHLSSADADNNINPIPNPSSYENISTPQTIFIRIENQQNPNCYELTAFQIIVSNSDPVNLDIDPQVACDDDNDGFFNNFDLTAVDDIITLGNPSIVISYHLTLADAVNNVGILSSPYANVVQDQQEIFFRALDINNGCEQFGSFFIEVVPSPLLTPITEPLVGCDNDLDGVLTFDLTVVEAEVLGSLDPTDLVITYHTSLVGAQTDTELVPIPTAFQNTSSPQSIWIKVVDTSNTNLCFDIEEFEIIVEPLPVIVDPEPLAVCDDDTGGDLSDEIATFDLNEVVDEITLSNNELNVEFFESEADLLADNPINPIDAYVNIANPQTLEVLVTSSTTGCNLRTTLTLVVDPIPTMAPVLDPIEVCDPDNDGFAEFDLEEIIEDILNNEPNVTITFHLTQADADLGVNPIDTSVPFGTSNNDTQTIYVRAENTGPNGDDGTGCFDTRPLDLIVVPSPEIANLTDLARCDDDSPNGFASFDLTINTPEALGTQDATQVVVTYHETQADAEAGTNAIAVPSNYTNITNPQTIYVRIFDTVTGCVDLFDSADDPNNTFTLTVEDLPEVFIPTALEVCDDDYNQNPFPQVTFDLTVKEPEIVGQPVVPASFAFTYFASQSDLDDGIAIADPTAYVNQAQPQTIYITVVDTDTENSCLSEVQMTINVLPLPSPSTTDPDTLRLTGCDDDNDGVAVNPFDLTFSGNFIAGSENVSLSYYLSESGAISEDPDELIADPTAYINDPALNETDENGLPTNIQIIYVRVDSGIAGNFCFVIVPFELVVFPNPELNPLGDPFAYTLCADDETDPNTATLFSTDDITNNLWNLNGGSPDVIIPLLDPNTTPAQDLADFNVTYHNAEQDAEDGINAISPGYLASDGEILFIRVTNIASECYNTGNIGQVQIIIQPRPDIAPDNPLDLVACADDFTNGIATVDLTQYDDLINPGSPANTQVVYYEGQMNYDNGIAIDDPVNFVTLQTPTSIIAEVINTLTRCESSRTLAFDIIINPLIGDISPFDGILLCVDAEGDPIFNEVSPPVIDTGLSENDFSFAWALDGVPIPDTTASITPLLPGVYTVVVINNFTGCQATSSAEVIANQAIDFNVDVITPAFSTTHVAEVNTITGNGNFEFQLDNGPWITLAPGQTTLTFTNISPGTHTITGRDQDGCGEVTIEFMVIDYPPFFTPNQDGFNETWNITALDEDLQATIYIFDRYGKLLKQISPRSEGWDGTYNGKAMPSQDYWFRVEFVEPTTGAKSEFKGHFTLKR